MKASLFSLCLAVSLSTVVALGHDVKPVKGELIVGGIAEDNSPDRSAHAGPEEIQVLVDLAELPVSKTVNPSYVALMEAVPPEYREHVIGFSPTELDTFLKKKAVFLENLGEYLKKGKLSVEKIEKIKRFVEDQLYKSSRLFLQANSMALHEKFLIRTGLSFNQTHIRDSKFGKTKVGQFLSSKKGYFYLLAAGASISRVVDPATNKAHVILDLHATKEDLKSVTTLIAELVTVDIFVAGVSMEVRKGNFDGLVFDRSKTKQTATYIGPGGRIVRDSGRMTFEFPISIPFVTSISAPPIASGLAFFESNADVYRYSINLSRLNPAERARQLWKFISGVWSPKVERNQCTIFYGG